MRACVHVCMYMCVCVCVCEKERTVNTYKLHYGVLLHENFFFIIVLVELYLTAKTTQKSMKADTSSEVSINYYNIHRL